MLLPDQLGFKANGYSAKMSPLLFRNKATVNFGKAGSEGNVKIQLLNKREPMDRALRELWATIYGWQV